MKIRSLKFNFIMNFILTSSNFIFPLITFPYISRVLSATGTGKVAFVTSVVSYFSMVAALGIPTYGIREVAKNRDNKDKLSKITQELFFIHMFMAILISIVFLISVCIIPKFQRETLLFLIVGTTIVLEALGVNWFYSGLEQYAYIAKRSIALKFIALIFMFICINSEKDYILYGFCSVFAASGSNILNFIRLRKFIYLKKYRKYNFKQHIRPIMVLFAQTVTITIYTNLDIIMLGFFKGDYDVGLYNATVRIKSIMVSLVTSLGAVLLPRLSYFIKNGKQKVFKELIGKSTNFVFVFALPIVTYLIIYSKQCILFIAGGGFLGAVSVMRILAPAIFFIGLSNVSAMQVLMPYNKEKYILYSTLLGACVDLLLNLIYIPKYGAVGAAIGTVAAEMIVFLFQYAYLKELFINVLRKIEIYKIIIALSFGAICSLKCSMYVNGNFLELLVSGIVFFIVYGITLLILKEKFCRTMMIDKLKSKFGL